MPDLWDALMAAAQGQQQPSMWPAEPAGAPDSPQQPLRITVHPDSAQAQPDAFEAAAARTRRSVMPPGGRQEGKFTQLLDSLGTSLYDTAARPSRIWNALQEVPPGQPLSERPDIVDAVAQTATDLVGAPGVTGGVPEGALGMAAKSGPLWSPISETQLRKPLSEMEHRYTDIRTPADQIFSPEQMVGGHLILTPGDLSRANRTLTHVDSMKLDRPVPAQGGPGFSEANPGLAWASIQGAAQKLDNQAAALAATGKPVYIAPMTMAPSSAIDASHHVADPLSQLVQQARIGRADATAFNDMMREAVPDWVSIRSPKFQDYISRQANMETKRYMADRMGLAGWQAKGFPDVAAVRHAMTEPGLIDVPRNTSGMAISQYIPGQGLIDTSHLSYPKGIAGQWRGRWPGTAPFDVAGPAIAKALAAKNAENLALGKKVEIQPRHHMEKPTRGLPTSQPLDNQWLDGIMKFFEMQKAGR